MPPCHFCHKDSAAYTCPRCSVTYCSLACYKCQQHAECSEAFYKEWVCKESNGLICNAPERQSIINVLRRSANPEDVTSGELDADTLSEVGVDGLSDDDGEIDLHERLNGLDLDRDTDEIWARLTVKERQEFERVVASRDILNLLPSWKPWWKVYSKPFYQVLSSDDNSAAKLSVFSKLVSSNSTAPLQYDICSVLVSYCLMCRFFNGEYKTNCDTFMCDVVAFSPCFDGINHRPAPSAAVSVANVCQRVTSFNEEFVSLLDATFVSKIVRDVAIILKSPRKEALYKAFVDILHIFDRGLSLLKISDKTKSEKEKAQTDSTVTSRKNALLAKKKLEYFSGWIVQSNEEVFQQCGSSLLALAEIWSADAMQFDMLKQEIEQSDITDLKMPDTNEPKIVEL